MGARKRAGIERSVMLAMPPEGGERLVSGGHGRARERSEDRGLGYCVLGRRRRRG